MSDQIHTAFEAERVLTGTVVEVSARSASGDFRLTFDDGRVVVIDTGYVGATLYVEHEDERTEA